ncbi:MAG: ABC transporter ATP-binding protein [Lachnospiraceae bacterium]|nr:ABC transporter ATP-binding protein [Lachnospiraceae bacterium]MCH4032297.1 ABC transporter ATP-binding protein [Lachnospiraceae bacterium]MCH4108825.1 ABC transporter ATP-binding protein [Lachnospiraceae bacterium]MCI1302356.1 ABC transporter ATP-binding protein [Lachnospiraceae bacterium]MCI1331521.1 ABC transporter ATP-binding protein [Lachnospiraceae bacterium]
MLKVENLNVYYGNIHALKDMSLTVNEGEIVSLIGANGAGKSTLMLSIMHQIPAKTGKVLFQGKDCLTQKTFDIVKEGMTLVPEGRHVFPRTSVQDNLLLGAYYRRDKSEVKKDLNRIYEMFPRLQERRRQLAGTLSGGEQQMLATARALMSRPKMLLLDEPSMGLAPIIVDQIFDTIVRINKEGTTILLVEQNANQALRIADRGYVLETGEKTMEDAADKLLANDQIREAYLGA